MKMKRGDIFLADLTPVVGAEMSGVRYVVILQSNDLNDEVSRAGGMVTVAPITSSTLDVGVNMKNAMLKIDIPEFSLFKNDYQVLLFQPRAIDARRLREHLARLSPETMAELDEKLKFALGL